MRQDVQKMKGQGDILCAWTGSGNRRSGFGTGLFGNQPTPVPFRL